MEETHESSGEGHRKLTDSHAVICIPVALSCAGNWFCDERSITNICLMWQER